jgi:hypothetical protein
MNRARRFFFLTGLFAMMVAALACSSDSLPREYRWIYGSWDWVRAVGAGDFRMTPESEGFRLTFVFMRDGRLEIYLNDQLDYRTNFSLVWNHEVAPGDSVAMLVFSDSTAYTGRRQLIRRAARDTLVLKSAFAEAPEVYFSRAEP